MKSQLVAGLLCLASLIAGQSAWGIAPPVVKNSAQAVVPCQQGSHLGSCTYIGDDLFVGCDHVAETDDTVYCGGRACTVVARNSTFDIVVMRAKKPVRGLVAAPVASKDVKVGDVVFGVGYGVSYNDEDGLETVQRRVFAGVVRGHTQPNSVTASEWYWLSSVKGARSGDSGGAIFNINGELVGDLWGRSQDGRITYAVDNTILRDLLKKVKK